MTTRKWPYFPLSKKYLFAIDGIGALVTATMLVLVLPRFQEWIGLPEHVLMFLGAIALCYAVFSFSCARRIKNYRPFWLKKIIFLNIFYCMLTISVLVYFFNTIKLLGIIYFSAEIFLILILVRLEIFYLKE